MRRREFITLLGGAGAACQPLIASAQQPQSMPRIAVMLPFPEDNPYPRGQADALRQGLKEAGWNDGNNIRIDIHWDAGEPDRALVIAKDIVAVQPDLIVSDATPATRAAAQLTTTIPIVFSNVADPVALGLVTSYARPGGNVTGFSNFEPSMGGKWMEVLKDLDAHIRRVAILFNPETAPASGKFFLPSFKAAGAMLGIEAIEAPVHDAVGIEQAIDALAREPDGALVAMADTFTGSNKELIIKSAVNHHLPLIGAYRIFPDAGGIISYGPNLAQVIRRAAFYVDRILKGEKPADLPVQAPTKYELVVNLKAARALGLAVPPSLLTRADEVIE